jgi:carboxypeptidase Q
MDVGLPARTIRIVWFGSEEVGLFGGIDYRNRYGKQPHYALMESDFGADRVYKVRSRLGDQRRSEAQMIGAALAPLGIVTGSFKETGGSDISVMLADGLPGVALDQDGLRYFDFHHTPDDTLDKVDPAQLRQNVAAWTGAVAVLAGPIEWKSEPNSDRRRY